MIANFVLDLLFPRRCIGCQSYGSLLCQACQATISCQLRLVDLDIMHYLERAYTVTSYDNELLKLVIHLCKYKSIEELAVVLSTMTQSHLTLQHLGCTPHCCITPVPLAAQRLRWRGFNQSAIVAERWSAKLNIEVWHGLRRSTNTAHQVGLNAQKRVANMASVFIAEQPPCQQVLLIDDVATTGATLDACAQALKKSGVREVIALTIAHGG